ncbi:YhdP family protein [Salinicola peritrichatus]|uniref:YhdP family phospholipid transporter n=1 Tax=Salinicola peritrichatus TaxID=1267424 RepID=UPI000DA178FE|nr:AsmA-like C-terminal region-containing protein [Salinicola peritrichatus]
MSRLRNTPLRATGRWLLTLVAVIAIALACVSTGLRLAALQIDRLSPWLVSWVEGQLDARAGLGHLALDIHHLDPQLTMHDLTLESRGGQPLLSVDHASGRFETLASWQRGAPIVTAGEIQGLTLHLYETPEGDWTWPEGAGSRWFGGSGPREPGRMPDIDAWLKTLLRQQAEIEDATLVLHGREREARVTLSRLALASRNGKASIQAVIERSQGQSDGSQAAESANGSAATLHIAIDGAGDAPQARFVGSLNLSALSPALAVLTAPPGTNMWGGKALGQADGRATISGEWRDGGLRSGRLTLDVPSLRIVDTRNETSETLTDLGLNAGLTRDSAGQWRAWIDDLRVSHAGLADVDWPSALQAQSTDDGWWLRTTPFDVDGMTDYLRFVPLPFDIAQPLIHLDPRGHVAGLEVGQDHGEWYAQSALEQVSLTAWNEIPGGGPVDAWATFRGRGGSVAFTGGEHTTFSLPSVYADPLDLSSASGAIDWRLTQEGAVFSGEDLKAGWRGASAEGRFGLTLFDADDKPGSFLLDLSFADADARHSGVLSWLPTRVIDDPQLLKWFGGDIGGMVKRGELGLSLTLTDKEAPEGQMFVNPDDRFTLSLDITDGHLQYAPDWPTLEDVEGHLQVDNMDLQAQVDHATSHDLTTRDATVTLADKQLAIDGHVTGSSGGLLDFLADAPLEDMSETFGLWQSEGRVDAKLHIGMPMTEQSDAETDMAVDVQGQADVDSLTFPELQLTFGDIDGDLRYRREKGEDYVTGTLDARALDGPLQARFNIGGRDDALEPGIAIQGQAWGQGILAWSGLQRIGGLLDGVFPYHAAITFDDQDNASLTLRSDLEGLAIHLPPPFGKSPEAKEALAIDADLGSGSGTVTLADWGRARWRTIDDDAQGQVWLEGWPGEQAAWPSEPGWYVLWRPNRVDTQRWVEALTQLKASDAASVSRSRVETTLEDDVGAPGAQPVKSGGGLKRVALSTPCILVEGRCLGGLQVDAAPLSKGWRLSLAGEIAAGEANWQPQAAMPIDVDLQRLNLDALTPEKKNRADHDAASSLMDEIETAPHPVGLPSWLAKIPAGHVRVAEFERQGQRFGPWEATWQADDRHLTVEPLALSLGELDLSGSLDWEASGGASLSRVQLHASGGNVGSAFRILGQPVPVTSDSAKADMQLSWPGAPWQFSLPLSTGRVQTTMNTGQLRQIHSSGAKLVGLFNLDNILRRLQLDFSDVTSGGTAFNRIDGSATLYDGVLKSQGPVVIEGTSTRFTLTGSVDLNRQTLNQRLGITVPVSQNLPLVAVMAGAPQVGLGLFAFHKLFGRWLDSATQIYYRIEGPWSSPNINLESAR